MMDLHGDIQQWMARTTFVELKAHVDYLVANKIAPPEAVDQTEKLSSRAKMLITSACECDVCEAAFPNVSIHEAAIILHATAGSGSTMMVDDLSSISCTVKLSLDVLEASGAKPESTLPEIPSMDEAPTFWDHANMPDWLRENGDKP